MDLPNALVNATGLCRYYAGHTAADNINLSLAKGEVLGLLGPNGAGKSTIIQMLSGTLATHAGQVLIDGIDLKEQPIEARKRIGYLPENPPLYRDMTPLEYLHFCGKLHGLRSTALRNAVSQAIDHCDLNQVTKRLIGNLSKGFQQRIGIAQAILHQPALIILDEPTVGLDPLQLDQIRQLIRELGKTHGVILSTHILQEIDAVCHRVQIINQGKTVATESLSALTRSNHTLASFFNEQLNQVMHPAEISHV